MIKPIVRDMLFLSQKSQPATKTDTQVIDDLRDTLEANKDRCIGMAANMIGVRKRVIIVNVGFVNMIMINPLITKKSQPYETEEGCLSLDGTRKTTRYNEIEVEFQDISFKRQKRSFSGLTAQIIQHEADHLDGIII